jgi:hypothetical protein
MVHKRIFVQPHTQDLLFSRKHASLQPRLGNNGEQRIQIDSPATFMACIHNHIDKTYRTRCSFEQDLTVTLRITYPLLRHRSHAHTISSGVNLFGLAPHSQLLREPTVLAGLPHEE